MSVSFNIALHAAVVCGIGILCTGCDNTFTPFSEITDDIISINGFLDVNADTQFVRVSVLRNEIEQNASENDSLAVALQDLVTLETIQLNDSLISVGDGQLGHLFYTDEPIQGDQSYTITATGPNDGASTQQTDVPGRIPFQRSTPSDTQAGYIQALVFPNLPRRPESLSVVYTVLRNGIGDPIRVSVPYRAQMSEVPAISGYQLTVRIEHDRSAVMSVLGLPLENETTVLQTISMEYDLLSDEWRTPRNPNDLDFFGSAATYEDEWTLSDAILGEIGYAVP